MLDKLITMIAAEHDTDATMGLRGLQGFFKAEGVDFGAAVTFAAEHMDELKKQGMTIDHVMGAKERAPVSISGMPQCRSPKSGCIELIPPGKTEGEIVNLSGEAANATVEIAESMKDVLVAAVINKSRFKLKLLDIKNAKEEVIETILRAEYERADMAPLRVWSNVRGEVGALATILRKGVANAFPDLVAA